MADAPFPGPSWSLAEPREAGFDAVKLARALEFAAQAETPWPRNLDEGLNADPQGREPPPWNEVLGPTKARAAPNGLVVRGGRIAGAYGDTLAVDMTFSVAKSYLAVLAGIALRDGLIRDLDDPVRDYALDDDFASPQNRAITWRHFLHQSSEWEGTLWGKPDLIDRNRQVGKGADNSRKGTHRDLRAPGDFYEYNDVRMNRFSLSLMQIFRRPLPEVLKSEIMDPIGASSSWAWHGYRNSTIELDGRAMTSVPGGSHWGGGIFMHSEDHARFALLVARDGCWSGRRILPQGWVDTLRAPSPTYARYGALWWLNTNRELHPRAPQTSFFAHGAGGNYLWLEPSLDLVAVMRWMNPQQVDDAIAMIMDSLA